MRPAALPLESPMGRVEGLAEAVRAGKPLPPADLAVLEHYVAVADDAGDWEGVADIRVAAELVDRGFRMHRLAGRAARRPDAVPLRDCRPSLRAGPASSSCRARVERLL